MYFFNTKALADKLKSGLIDTNETVKYLIAGGLFYYAAYNFSQSETVYPSEKYSHYPSLIIGLAALFYTIRLAYQWNQKGDNKDFITRYICMDFVLTLKFLVIMLPLFILSFVVLIIIFSSLGYPTKLEYTEMIYAGVIADVFFIAITNLWFIFYMNKWVRYISGENEDLKTMDNQAFKRSAAIGILGLAIFIATFGLEYRGTFKDIGGYKPASTTIETLEDDGSDTELADPPVDL